MQSALGVKQKFQVAVMATMLLLGNPAWAELNSEAQSKLSNYETTIFGQDFPKLSEHARLSKLEATLFGKTHKGADFDRLEQIQQALSGTKSAKLSPALPPELDRSEETIRQAPEVANSNDDGNSVPVPSPAYKKQGQTEHLLAQAVQYYSQGNMTRAEALFHQVLTLDSRNADAHYNLGAINESRGNLAEALRQYQAAFAANPQDSDIAQAVTQVKDKLQQSALAQKQTKDQEQANSQETEQLKKLAQSAATDFHNNNYDQAIAKLNQVSSQAPDNADVHYALAQAWRAKDKDNPARSCLMQARYHLGQALSIDPQNQNYKQAFDDVNKLLASRNSTDIASAEGQSAPPGQIIPITPPQSSPTSTQYGFASSNSQGMGRFLPAMGLGLGAMTMGSMMSGGRGGGGQTRLSRAIGGSLAGAAIGGLMGSGTAGGARNGSIKGALMGGALGLLFGGL